MKTTSLHLTFWRQKKATPSWAIDHTRPRGVSIHALINVACAIKVDYTCANTLALVRIKMQRGSTLREALLELSQPTHSHPLGCSRISYCNRWLKRLGTVGS